ncbi:MAG: hypothetical protein IT374_26165 [Polyangiaceae bacterium]|nr:hypothetical protein [Polyangiaceae bacterium]
MKPPTASAPVSSGRVAREVRADEMSALFRRSLDAHGASRKAVAITLGVTRSRVDDYCDPEHEAGLRAADIAALPPAVVYRWRFHGERAPTPGEVARVLMLAGDYLHLTRYVLGQEHCVRQLRDLWRARRARE